MGKRKLYRPKKILAIENVPESNDSTWYKQTKAISTTRIGLGKKGKWPKTKVMLMVVQCVLE